MKPIVEIKRATNKEWYAVVYAKNGKMLYKSSETYKRISRAKKSVTSLLKAMLRFKDNPAIKEPVKKK